LAATGYYINIADNAVKDDLGNRFVGVSDATTINFTTVAPSEVQMCSSGSAELWFVNDESGSVDSTEFTQSTTFMSYVEDGFSFSSSEFRGGIISWSSAGDQSLESSLTTSFQSAIDTYAATTPFGNSTAPAEALTYAATQVTNGARAGVPSVVVLMTDASDTQLTSNSANFIAAADSIRATTGNEVVVMLIAEAATAYGATSSVKTTIDAVAGSSANVIVGASYADIASPTNSYINSLVGTVCTVAAAAATELADTTGPVITGPVGPNAGSGTTTGATSAISVNENQTAVTQVSATDNVTSAANITWTLSGDDAGKFAIATNGTITFNSAPDYEAPNDVGATANNNTYVVVITAEDEAGNTTSQTLTVTVVDVNEVAVDWVDWTMPTSYPNNNTAEMLTYSRTQRSYATSASGTVVDPNTNNTVSVTLTGEILDQSLNATTWVNSENPTSAYDVGTVTSPDGEDLITQTGYTAQADKHHTITFDQPVDGVVMGIWSLGGNGVSSLLFSEDFEIIDTETNGLTKNVTDQGYELVGTAHSTDAGAAGIIQFYGSGLTSITYTVTRPEYYSGMNVALTTNSLTGTGGATKSIDVTAPVIQGPSGEPGDATSAIEVMAEQTAVTQFTADETVTWRVSGGTNASAFTLNATTGVITFTTAPSYDATTPANNIYVVEVEAKDATGNTSRQTLTVTVIPNIYPNEPGSPSEDADGDGAFDNIESATLDRDGDGIVDRQDYDPQGYFYCQADGRILSGGKVTVSGPGTVTMVHDGSETNAFAGNYQWYVDTPGTYTMAIDTSGMEFRSISKPTSGSMTVADFTGNPVILGSTELGATGYLGQFNGAAYDPANPTDYYTTFVIAAGDPNIFGNNIPFELCEQNDVTVAATTFGAEANGGTPTNAVFRVSQPRTSLVDTVITYTVSGTATADADYTALSGSVTIPAGQTSADITATILDDVLIEGPETIIVTLTGITGDESTQLSSTSANLIGTATIADDDFATVIMANDDLNTTEGRDDPATIRFSLAGQPSGPVILTFAGDAQCSVSPSTLTFDGTDFATPQTLRIQALNDEVVEGAHTCQPTVVVTSTDTRFNGLAVTLATVNIADDLVDQIRDPLTNILQSDFQQAVATHSRQFGQISKGALGRLQSEEDLRCGDIEALDVDGTAEAGQGAFSTAGTINEDTFNCVTGVRRITKGSFAVNSSPSIDTQGIFTLTVQNEKIVNDTALRGFFYGGYLSSASLDGVATGNINGVGAHVGVYGANELSNGLFFDYYAAGAYGRHDFDLSFYAPTAPIEVLGDYRYGALYAGAALSGEVEYDSVIFRPRAGFNLTYAEASDADVSATQLGITDTGRIELDTIGGTRIFAEAVWTFGEAPSSDEAEQGAMDQNMRTFEVAPRIYCTSGVTRDSRDCGYGGYISFNERNDLKGTDIAITFDYESNRERSEYLGLELSYSRDIFDGAGAMVTQFGSDHLGNAALSQSVSLDF
ncbi:MAG: VWA domain-containing protein, partial [Marivivens sp.]|nr:VWA domain-containing protein [Marivivens sp.]